MAASDDNLLLDTRPIDILSDLTVAKLAAQGRHYVEGCCHTYWAVTNRRMQNNIKCVFRHNEAEDRMEAINVKDKLMFTALGGLGDGNAQTSIVWPHSHSELGSVNADGVLTDNSNPELPLLTGLQSPDAYKQSRQDVQPKYIVHRDCQQLCLIYSVADGVLFRTADTLTVTEKAVALVYALRLARRVYRVDRNAVPMGILGAVNPRTAGMPHTTPEVLAYALMSIGKARLRPACKSVLHEPSFHLLDMGNRIVFTFQCDTTKPDSQGCVSLRDNYGVTHFSATGLVGMQCDMCVFEEASQQCMGVVRGNSGAYTGLSAQIMNQTGTMELMRASLGVATVSQGPSNTEKDLACAEIEGRTGKWAGSKLAEIRREPQTILIDLLPNSSLPLHWRVIILMYAMKLSHNYYRLYHLDSPSMEFGFIPSN